MKRALKITALVILLLLSLPLIVLAVPLVAAALILIGDRPTPYWPFTNEIREPGIEEYDDEQR